MPRSLVFRYDSCWSIHILPLNERNIAMCSRTRRLWNSGYGAIHPQCVSEQSACFVFCRSQPLHSKRGTARLKDRVRKLPESLEMELIIFIDSYIGCKTCLIKQRLSANIAGSPGSSRPDGMSRRWCTEPCSLLCQTLKARPI
jgi:hypothetical protein